MPRICYSQGLLGHASKISLMAASVFMLAIPIHASAQVEADNPDQVSTRGRVDEILVTGTKKSGAVNVQDVGGAVTAFGAEQLSQMNFQNLQSLTYSMPNVQLESIGTVAGYANFSIRGLGINSSILSIDPTVGVFVDGVYMGINAGVVFDNFDLEGIEVLRGPQGVLFGRNVTGGAVLVNTKAPSFDPYFNARAKIETGLSYTLDTSMSGPIIEDKLAAKIAIYMNEDEGYFENLNDGESNGQSSSWIVRPAFLWTPSADVDVTFRLEHGERDGQGPSAQNHALFSRDSLDFSIDERGFQNDKWSSASVQADWSVGFGDGVITNVLGWREFSAEALIDVDSTPGAGFHAHQWTDQHQLSNELRYAGTFGAMDVTVGAFVFSQTAKYVEQRIIAGGAVLVSGGGTQKTDQFALFANADWHLNDQFTINAGIRYSKEEKDAVVALFRPNGCDLAALACDFTFDDVQDWSDVSPKLGVQWQPNDDTNVYAYWAKGFRSGGYNLRQTSAASNPGPFEAEDQNSFEIGVKQDFADGKARVNLAAFHNTIDNNQREINLPSALGIAQSITNVGELTIKGFEAEGQLYLSDSLMVTGQLGYTHGEYTRIDFDLNSDGVIDSGDFDLQPPRLAPWTYGASIRYTADLPAGELTSLVSFNHRDATFYSDNNLGLLNAVDSIDANFSFRPDGSSWSFAVYGSNLLNETTFGGDSVLPDSPLFGGDGDPTTPAPTFSPLNKGRVFGVEVKVSY